jgi:hypothetical protein
MQNSFNAKFCQRADASEKFSIKKILTITTKLMNPIKQPPGKIAATSNSAITYYHCKNFSFPVSADKNSFLRALACLLPDDLLV